MLRLGKSSAKKQRTQQGDSVLSSLFNRKRKADESNAQSKFNDDLSNQNLSLAFNQHSTSDKENRRIDDISQENHVPNLDSFKTETKTLSHDSTNDDSMIDCYTTSTDNVSSLTSQDSSSIESNEKTSYNAIIVDLQNKLAISNKELATTTARLQEAHATIDKLKGEELPPIPNLPLENNQLYQNHMKKGGNMKKMYGEEDQKKLKFERSHFNDHAYQTFNNEPLDNNGKFTLERQRDKPIKVNLVDDPKAKVKYRRVPSLKKKDLDYVLYNSIQDLQNGKIDEHEFAKRFECTIYGKNVSKHQGNRFKLVVIAKVKSSVTFEKWTKVKYLKLENVDVL